MEYSIKPKSLGERRIIHYPQKRIIGLYVSSTAGVTSSAGTIKFNTYQMDNFTSAQKRNVCTHELGHALGLAHNAKGDVMYAYVSSVISLSANDKASYDASYKRY